MSGLELLRSIKQNAATMLANNTRNAQLLSLSSAEEARARQQAEQAMNRKVWVALVSTGIAAAGFLWYAPLALLSLPGIMYINKDIFRSARHALVEQHRANVDLLTCLCNLFLLLGGHLFWCSFAGIIFSVNRKVLNTVRANTKSNLVDVFRQQPRTAWVVCDGVECEVLVTDLTAESVIRVGAGELIPVDGQVLSGMASIDQRILTGESQPAEKVAGDKVFAATLVLSGQIQVQVRTLGEQMVAAQIGQLLNNTSDDKTNQQLKVESFSDKTIVPTLAAGLVTLPILGSAGALVVIQSHFEHRMTIVSSIGLLNYLNLASHHGLLVKDGGVFERLQQIDTIVFDKTGTLTEEIPKVGHIHLCADYTTDQVLQYAAAAEGKQTHPVAQAIVQAAQARQLSMPIVKQAEYQMGYGLSAMVAQQRVQLGSMRFIESQAMHLPDRLKAAYTASADQGHSMIFLAIAGQLVAGIELQPQVRAEAKSVIAGLRQYGVQKTYIISGDQHAPTHQLATHLGIDAYFAEVLPEQKAELIADLQAQGRTVCFVGDGINDCVAMKQADVAISLGDASTVATDTAQVILLDNHLTQLCDLFDIAKQYCVNIKRTYAMVAIPSLVSVGGAFLWNFGLLQAMLIPQMGLVVGALYTLYPLLKKPVIKAIDR